MEQLLLALLFNILVATLSKVAELLGSTLSGSPVEEILAFDEGSITPPLLVRTDEKLR